MKRLKVEVYEIMEEEAVGWLGRQEVYDETEGW